jgi:hypothetical protein
MLRDNEVKRLEMLRSADPGSLNSTLPYAAYCLRTALIFHFGLAFNLVSTRATNRLDLEYFYYAPFCHVFSSKDRFHRKMASVIVQDQMFVSGDGLKADLADLARQQSSNASNASEADKTHGPPTNDGSITYQAWMKTSKAGFSDVAKEVASHLTPEESAKLFVRYQDISKSKSQSETPSIGMDDCDFIIMEHSVRLDGPCICGSPKLFKDCCGQKLDKKASGLPPAS